MRMSGTALIVAALALESSLLLPNDLEASAVASTQTTTLSWGVAAAPSGSPPTLGPYVLSWSVSGGTAYEFIDFVNVGTADTAGYVFMATVTPSGGGGGRTPNVTFDVCENGSWNQSTNTCPGSQRTLGTASTFGLSVTMPSLAVNTRVSLRASTPANSRNNAVTSLMLSVSRHQVRPPLTDNS